MAALSVFLDPGLFSAFGRAADTLTCFQVNQPNRPAASV
jgi:hypothetical protein